jgi:hypothetical protein
MSRVVRAFGLVFILAGFSAPPYAPLFVLGAVLVVIARELELRKHGHV